MNEATEQDRARFWAKVAPANEQGCMLWMASKTCGGYGTFWLDGRLTSGHRVSYELANGPIPDGLQIDHLCRVRHCVNPAHLEAVTQAENIRRGDAGKATGTRQRAKARCPQGHLYSEANTYVAPRGDRQCRTCAYVREAGRRSRAKALQERADDYAAVLRVVEGMS